MKKSTKKDNDMYHNYGKKLAGNIQVFLDIFGLHLDHHGFVLNEHNTMLGKVDFTLVNGVDVSFSCRNGVVKMNSPLSMNADNYCLSFNIQNNSIQSQMGHIRSVEVGTTNGKNLFGFDGLNLTNYEKGNRINNIQICDDGRYFYYINYLTGQKIGFSAISLTGGICFTAERKTDIDSHYIYIQATSDNTRISELSIYDRKTASFIPTDELMKKLNPEDSIWCQMSQAITLVYPEFYQDVNKIVDYYDNKGVNLVKKSIVSTRCDDMSEEAFECCFGKELMKRISLENI